MFKEWGFLLTEIWVLLALAVLLGLLAGWLIWGGRKAQADGDDAFSLQMQLDRESARAKAAEEAASAARADAASLQDQLDACRAAQVPAADLAPPAPAAVMAETAPPAQSKPQTLDAPRDGLPDDLTKISGIGPKLSALCNRLGFYHFDQIAAWTDEEIAWVDYNLEGFKGRVTRDNWVAQAKDLAKNTTS